MAFNEAGNKGAGSMQGEGSFAFLHVEIDVPEGTARWE